ncbi:MAG: DUF4058 family protein [Chloroflexi bacterium]|nr:DUF4058 family protein [Chloroflexota bacterium]
MTFAFPGMDPYLEHHDLWSDVHSRLITALADAITPLLPPPYYAAVETRSYVADPEALLLAGRPDLLIGHEREAPPPLTVEQTAVAGAGFAEGVMVELPAPDVVRETYLEVREPPGDEAIAVLEILSPDNKQPGEGRRQYQAKRRRVFDSLTHFVEIDLLRGGQRFPYRVRRNWGVCCVRYMSAPVTLGGFATKVRRRLGFLTKISNGWTSGCTPPD